MNILALLGRLGHALVSWGLGGPGEAQATPSIHCPTVRLRAAVHTVAGVEAAEHVTVELQAAAHTIARISGDC